MQLSTRFTLSLLLATTLFGACKKGTESSVAPTQTVSSASAYNPLQHMGRYAGDDYSQSISIGLANSMISSYLTSVKYPAQDTAIRSFAFDADTLRSYLADQNIKTLRFHVAHTPSYSQQTPGKYAGYSPQALTLIIVGYSTNDEMIRNKHNGVYEHAYPCPRFCNQGGGLL